VKKISIAFLIAIFAMCLGVATWAATTTVVSGGIVSGKKNIESLPVMEDFPEVTEIKDKSVVVKTGLSGPLVISDFSGNGDGWRLGVWASQFQEEDGGVEMLPKGSLVLSFPQAVKVTNPLKAPVIKQDQPWVLDGDLPVTIVKADKNQGAGSYEINFPEDALSLTLNPGTTSKKPTLYESTLTWLLIAGP
jgi:hypothetical protein